MFLPFLHTFPHVSPIVSPVSLGISHVSPGVPPYFLIFLLNRSSCDNKTNLYGRILLKLCNNHSLKIVSGQTPEERIGNCTWFIGEGTSISDYLLVEKLKKIGNLKILPPKFESKHTQITATFRIRTTNITIRKLLSPAKACKWASLIPPFLTL